jgi:hypothetical protein
MSVALPVPVPIIPVTITGLAPAARSMAIVALPPVIPSPPRVAVVSSIGVAQALAERPFRCTLDGEPTVVVSQAGALRVPPLRFVVPAV